MLILTSEDIESCFVQLPDMPPSIGFKYRNWHFYFDSHVDNYEKSVAQCHDWLDNPEKAGELRALVKDSRGGCQLCVHLPELQPIPEDTAMKAICEYMRTSGEIKVGSHRYQLRIFKKCFVGSEAVTWIADRLKMPRDRALEFGRKCLKQGLFCHVLGEEDFEDSKLLYRFAGDGGPDQKYQSFVLSK